MVDNVSKGRSRKLPPIVVGCAIILAVIACTLVTALVKSGFIVLSPDERGVVVSAIEPKGYRSESLGPGSHWVIPFVEYVHIYSTAPQTYVMAADTIGDDSIMAQTKDGRYVAIDVSVVYAVDPAKVVDLYLAWQERYIDELVRPTTRGTTRAIVLQHSPAEIIGSKRVEIEQTISMQLEQQFADADLILIHYAIQDVRLK